mgnify:CR=1 FL=1
MAARRRKVAPPLKISLMKTPLVQGRFPCATSNRSLCPDRRFIRNDLPHRAGPVHLIVFLKKIKPDITITNTNKKTNIITELPCFGIDFGCNDGKEFEEPELELEDEFVDEVE